MDRTSWIGVITCVVALVAWQVYTVKTTPLPTPPAQVASAEPAPAEAAASPASTHAPAADAVPAPTPRPALMSQKESLFSRSSEYVFGNDLGGIERAILLLHLGENSESVALNGGAGLPIGAIGMKSGEALGGFAMSLNPEKGEAVFRREDADGLIITKRFSVYGGDSYMVRMELEFQNVGASPTARDRFFVSTGGAAPIHANDLPIYTRFEWSAARKVEKIDVNWFSPSSVPLLGIEWRGARSLYEENKPDVNWAAVTSQYFCTIATVKGTPANGAWAMRFDTRKQNNTPVYGIEGGLVFPEFSLQPGQTQTHEIEFYIGPKELGRLRNLGGGQDAVMNFGMFGIVSELLLWAMNSLYAILHNYAAAIIVLTIIIKTLLWPIQNKATKEMRKMALLSPKMTEMREKYKDDPQKLNEEMMKLYREYGVNPFSGCLPMLIQIPIFFGFYSMLGVAIELRNSSFLWVPDLSQPDTVGHIFGFPINVLPLVMAGTMVWQMAITPKSGDAMQQRIFYFMPIIFLVFCYNYASGLALYWTTQNIFSIVQLYLTRNKPLPTLEKKSVVAKREALEAKKKKKKGR